MDSISLFLSRPLAYSEWHPWLDRNKIPQINLPGIYLLARFTDGCPDGPADPLCSGIVVIGETRRSLRGRLKQFHDAAFGNGGPHGVGKRYSQKTYLNSLEALYVAILPVSPLNWAYWMSMEDEELAHRFSLSSQNVISIEDIKRFKKWYEQDASAQVKGKLNGAWIKYIERKLLMDYILLHGELPECNVE
jgi:hypothetical protein